MQIFDKKGHQKIQEKINFFYKVNLVNLRRDLDNFENLLVCIYSSFLLLTALTNPN